MIREGRGTLTPVGYHALGRVYPRDRARSYLVPHERTPFQRAPVVPSAVLPIDDFVAVESVRWERFEAADYTWLYPTSMGAPEYAPYIREEIVDTEDCFLRRPEEEHACLRRSDEDETALRRAPECPDQFACPVSGCV